MEKVKLGTRVIKYLLKNINIKTKLLYLSFINVKTLKWPEDNDKIAIRL